MQRAPHDHAGHRERAGGGRRERLGSRGNRSARRGPRARRAEERREVGPERAARSSAASMSGAPRPCRGRARDDHVAEADDRERADRPRRRPRRADRGERAAVAEQQEVMLLAPLEVVAGRTGPARRRGSPPSARGQLAASTITAARSRAAGPPAAAGPRPGPSASNASPSRPTCSVARRARSAATSRGAGWRSGAGRPARRGRVRPGRARAARPRPRASTCRQDDVDLLLRVWRWMRPRWPGRSRIWLMPKSSRRARGATTGSAPPCRGRASRS